MKNLFRSGLIVLALINATAAKAQVPVLSSYPSASAVIFLDFDGQTIENTSWNYAGPIVCGASGLTTTQITSVFNRVAEDYRPFNINVTTDSTVYFAAPANKRMRIVLTVTYEWYGAAGGVAFVGSYIWGDNTPCFVFTGLLNYNEKNIAEAASHEAGHTLGLYHQSSYNASCVKTADYNPGQGSGEIGWAPIMGVGYYRNLTLWNNGPNSYGCNEIQNDLSVITTGNGFGFRTDDYPSTFGGATTVAFQNGSFTVNGVVEQNTDQDIIKFTMPGLNHFVLNAIPTNIGAGNIGSNIDIQVTLYNSSQNIINIFNPGTFLNAIIDTNLNGGTYYLRVEGKGNIYAPAYASLGGYALQGSYSTSTLPLRRLELQGELVNDRHRLNWIIDADEQVILQSLEISRDGRTFQQVTQPAAPDRSFLYVPNISSAVQYRLKVEFDNGKSYYSNVVTLRNVNNDLRPKLMGNMISSGMLISSPGTYNYSIYDFNGKLTSKGVVSKGMNAVSSGNLAGGMYLIRFDGTNGQFTDKFVKE